jgi:hypothetical protein
MGWLPNHAEDGGVGLKPYSFTTSLTSCFLLPRNSGCAPAQGVEPWSLEPLVTVLPPVVSWLAWWTGP